LQYVYLDSATSIDGSAFRDCPNLVAVVLGNEQQVATLDYVTSSMSAQFNFYVPDNLVSSYQSATNWSQYA